MGIVRLRGEVHMTKYMWQKMALRSALSVRPCAYGDMDINFRPGK